MAGIYIHIPFCKKICYYCDFHFSLNLKNKAETVAAICKEIELQKEFFAPKKIIETIYFGGGTPSVLHYLELAKILDTIYEHFTVSESVEITLECNPDDLTRQYCRDINILGINRLSIGVQSFHDEDLEIMNRRHNSYEAAFAIRNAQEVGFKNITIDLMYGLPKMTLDMWRYTLNKAMTLGVQHISAYALTIEPQTAFNKFVKTGTITMLDDSKVVEQFNELKLYAQDYGFEQYEISNFAKNEMYSKHNTSYWKQKPYLGIGPSAHSYNGEYRFWNVAHNRKYIESIQQDNVPQHKEMLTQKDVFNEYVMTGLRTKWGVNLNEIQQKFPGSFYQSFQTTFSKYVTQNLVTQKENSIILTNEGKMISDRIMSDFFIV